MEKERVSDTTKYYDGNTKLFLSLGQGRNTHSMHRAVWGEGVQNRTKAFLFVNELVLKELAQCGANFVIDLGCGVGGSMCYLAERWKASYAGITNSQIQAGMGAKLFEKKGSSKKCRIVIGDFLDPHTYHVLRENEQQTKGVSLAFAIESFVHSQNPEAFFRVLATQLKKGDHLILCDDFLLAGAWESAGNNKRLQKWLQEYRRGWHVHTLLTIEETLRIANSYGFTKRQLRDLTPFLELDRLRDLVIRGVVALFRFLPINNAVWSNLIGGNALQLCLKARLLGYFFLHLEKL